MIKLKFKSCGLCGMVHPVSLYSLTLYRATADTKFQQLLSSDKCCSFIKQPANAVFAHCSLICIYQRKAYWAHKHIHTHTHTYLFISISLHRIQIILDFQIHISHFPTAASYVWVSNNTVSNTLLTFQYTQIHAYKKNTEIQIQIPLLTFQAEHSNCTGFIPQPLCAAFVLT